MVKTLSIDAGLSIKGSTMYFYPFKMVFGSSWLLILKRYS
jgi:hypothetical protein